MTSQVLVEPASDRVCRVSSRRMSEAARTPRCRTSSNYDATYGDSCKNTQDITPKPHTLCNNIVTYQLINTGVKT